MNITIKAKNTTLTAAIRATITEKLAALEKFLKSEDKLHVEVDVDKKHKSGLVRRAEVTIQPHGQFAEARGNDFYEAFDLLIPKIKEQLVKKKEKIIDKGRKAARSIKGK